MTDSVRAAAEKLVQILDDAAKTPGAPSDDECIAGVEALENLRTALAQPEEGELTDEELLKAWDTVEYEALSHSDVLTNLRAVEAAVIARCPAHEPPAEGEVGELSVVHATAPERIWLYLNGANEYLPFRNEDDVVWSPDPIDSSDIPYVRADLLVQRHPAPVPVAALSSDYREPWDMSSEDGSQCFASAIMSRLVGVDAADEADARWLAAYLQANSRPQHFQPAPVPVSERLPGVEDCDAEGRCWVGYPELTYSIADTGDTDTTTPEWRLEHQPLKPKGSRCCWLPVYALPLPAGEGS